MKSILFTLALMPFGAGAVMAQIDTAPVSAQRPIPSPMPTAQVYTLEPKQAGVVCENGKLDWSSELKFPAGMYRVNPSPRVVFEPASDVVAPPRENSYTLSFHVLKDGRLTNIMAVPAGGAPLFGNQFLPVWAAGWSLGPQAQTLKGCKMTWAVRTDHAPEMAMLLKYEALHLRNYMNIPYTDARSEACRAAGKQVRSRAYPDSRTFRRAPGRPQRVVTRYDVLDTGKVRLGAQVVSEARAEDAAEIAKALSQLNYYSGAAAQDCLYSYIIPPAPLPSNDASLWPELRELYRDSFYKDEGPKDCPNDDREKIMPFVFNAELYPAEARRMKIEGMAMVRFDIAPWGEVRIRSTLSHPLPQFARAAEQMVRQSTAKASERGYSGCQVMVRFANPADPAETDAES
ncbi:TonB family protein [Asticcacaulis machinosus]|uniref:TonB family protein n=1 Tax=Asticcacaulis machinosus TaxID=2984211 RepID=A0ABT5HHT1_9CAUL|nr:TonB family protein [Asticcacaulis machinosus]MDC7675809.1 TonB family protein [Asticcacaulis machinosus]